MKTLETKLAQALLGRPSASVLMTDAYKFSMAQAGAPEAIETFYLSLRRPGWYLVPVDLEALVLALCPEAPTQAELDFLKEYGFELSAETREALGKTPSVVAAPKGSWVREGEPVVTVTGPSALVSWLEPLLIWLHLPMQIATAVVRDGVRELPVDSRAEAEVVRCILKAIGAEAQVRISVAEAEVERSYAQAARLVVASAGGDAGRIFEVGMRGAGCMENHRKLLMAARAAGVQRTSNVFLARELGMRPVGTTGHEHQQRWGSDLAAFRAVRDRRPQPPSYLFDTYNAMERGIPAAIEALREASGRAASVRFDSGNYELQLRAFVDATDVRPTYVFMDSMRPERIEELESLCDALGIERNRRQYGVGGYLRSLAANPYRRDRVAAVYKLSESGGQPVMKFSTAAKRSLPGRPTILRRCQGDGAIGCIAQVGEPVPAGFERLHPSATPPCGETLGDVVHSAATKLLVKELESKHFS